MLHLTLLDFLEKQAPRKIGQNSFDANLLVGSFGKCWKIFYCLRLVEQWAVHDAGGLKILKYNYSIGSYRIHEPLAAQDFHNLPFEGKVFGRSDFQVCLCVSRLPFSIPLKIGTCDAFSFYKPKPPIK